MEYKCQLKPRRELNYLGICNKCIAEDCDNPIGEIETIIMFRRLKERVYLDITQKPYAVLSCEGYKEK